MLHDAAVIETVAAVIAGRAAGIPLVLDPVMVAKGGAPLIEEGAIGALKRLLVPHAAVLTPNLPEAEILAGHAIIDVVAMREAADELRGLGCHAVLLKGGHLPGDTVYDVLATADGQRVWNSPRIDSRHTHGTGCTLASAIATGLAQGQTIEAAVERARTYVQRAIAIYWRSIFRPGRPPPARRPTASLPRSGARRPRCSLRAITSRCMRAPTKSGP